MILVFLAWLAVAAPPLDAQVRRAQAQLDGGDARAALKSAEKIHEALRAGEPLPPALRDALDAIVIGAHTALAGATGEDPARRLDDAMAAWTACADRSGAAACGDAKPLARALRARAGALHAALLAHQGSSGTEARTRCDQAAAVAPDPASDARCLAMSARIADDPELAARAAAAALAAPEPVPAVDEAVAAAADVIGYRHGRFAEALALVDAAIARGEAPSCAAIRPSLAAAEARITPKRAAVEANPDDAEALRALLTTLEAAKLDALATRHARAALDHADPRVREAAGVALFNAAARAAERREPGTALRPLFRDAATAFDGCAAAEPRCAARAAEARRLEAAVP